VQTLIRGMALVAGLTCSAAMAGGCRTYIAIKSLEPGPVNIGPGKHLVIMQTEGRRSAREELIETLKAQARRHGYFTVADESETGADVRVAGRKVTVSGGPKMAADHIGVVIRVEEWGADRDIVQRERRFNETVAGKLVPRVEVWEERVVNGEAVLSVPLFTPSGRAIAAEREYEGRAQGSGDASKEDMRVAAGQDAIARMLAEITPRTVTRHVMVDKSDDAQFPMIELAARGQLAQAAEDMDRYARANRQNEAAAYNLAVFSDAMGDFDAALGWYDRALSLSGGAKPWYQDARNACAARKKAADSLGG